MRSTDGDGTAAAVLADPENRPVEPEVLDQDLTVASQPWWRRASSHRIGRYWKPLAMLAASRVATFFVLFVSHYVPSSGKGTVTVVGGIGGGHHLDRLAAWDGGWYIAAAQHGWPHAVPSSGGFPSFSTLAFFPGFPLTIRAVHVFGISWLLSGFMAALACQIVMVILMWQLFKEIWGEHVADRGMLLFLFVPGAVAFSLIYSEPMLFAAAAACLLALRRRWWLVAGVSAAVGAAVRPVGAALIVCCIWESIKVIRSERRWSSIVAPLLAPVGLLGWMGYLWAHTGDPFIWSKAEKAWDDSFDPLTLIKRFVSHQVTHTGQRLPHYLPVAGAVFCIVALILLYKAKAPASLFVYSAVVVFIAASSKIVNLRPRLVETAFPLVVVFGYWLKDTLFSVVLACSGVALGGLLFLTLVSPKFIP
jgi:hypothetical protein